MRTAIRIAALVAAAAMAVVFVSKPSQDAAVPAWMGYRVEAGRASLIHHVDLIAPGSPLVLTGAHCRDDGAVRLVYRNRYLWVAERRYFTDAPEGWSLGSMSGGVLSDGEDSRTAEGWLLDHEEVDCGAPPSAMVTTRLTSPSDRP